MRISSVALRFPVFVAAVFAALVLYLSSSPAAAADLREGLIVEYRSLVDPARRVVRVEPRPALAVPPGSSVHPRLPEGPFAATWRGLIESDDERAALLAEVSGEVVVRVGDATVLESRSTDSEGAVLGLAIRGGLHPLVVEYRSLEGVPARLRFFWKGERFSREPLSPFYMKHRDSDEPGECAEEARRERGFELSGRFGCGACHGGAFPSAARKPDAPSLAGSRERLSRDWIARWLDGPQALKPGARMPRLFADDRRGRIEREIIALRLGDEAPPRREPKGDHRQGKKIFHFVGCAACHFLPERAPAEQAQLDRLPLEALADRLPSPRLAAFLENPSERFPQGAMPRVPLSPGEARDLEAYLLLWSKPASNRVEEAVGEEEIAALQRELGASSLEAAADLLIRRKRCAACHEGLEPGEESDVPVRRASSGCPGTATLPRFSLAESERAALTAYLEVASLERHRAPREEGLRLLKRHRCGQCHAHAGLRPPPIEEVGATLGGSYLERIPYLRSPRLLDPHSKYSPEYLSASVESGVKGVRGAAYTYRMPGFGAEAPAILQALALRDGEPLDARAEPAPAAAESTLSEHGPALVGFEGYSCVSCHLWKGTSLHEPDPGSIGPDLITAPKRLRREWFDRWLADPSRLQPGTPMPQVFPHGEKAPVAGILGGDPERQRDALWAYFGRGDLAPGPRPLPPIEIQAPANGEPLVAQTPVRLPDGTLVDALVLMKSKGIILVVDLANRRPHRIFWGARLLRHERGRLRFHAIEGSSHEAQWKPAELTFLGYERLKDGARLRWDFAGGTEELRFLGDTYRRWFHTSVEEHPLLFAEVLRAEERRVVALGAPVEGSLDRPGYRAIPYPRPKLPNGEDLLMPGAVAVDPKSGRVFVASMKLGQLFVVEDPGDDGRRARFADYTNGLFEEAYSMLADPGWLYVLHRGALTRIEDADGDGRADRFERVAKLPHGVGGTYDYAYGLARDRDGRFVFGYAPYASRTIEGSGGGVRLLPGPEYKVEEVTSGLRNPVGWCSGPDGEVFCTDNQGEWVATNKVCHAAGGRYHGFPNPERAHLHDLPRARPAVWVPYDWAHSLNGIAFDSTGGRFGPFAGQLFVAELMFGGAVIRVALEKVGGEYQGAAFPFWGKGLLGPLCLAFDPRGRLWVGSITEPGWMAQPDRGALFRVDFTGEIPFEMHSIRARPRGFRILFTKEIAPETAGVEAFDVESYRYEFTPAYGSPEYDRARHAVRVESIAPDRRAVDLDLDALRTDHVYLIASRGVRSRDGEPLVHPVGAYTLNALPDS